MDANIQLVGDLTFLTAELRIDERHLVRIGYSANEGWWYRLMKRVRGNLKTLHRRSRCSGYIDARMRAMRAYEKRK